MSIADHDSLPVFLPIISVRRGSYGAIPFTTGMHFRQLATDGALIAYMPCLRTWMQFAWITSAGLPPHGTSRRARLQLSPDNGKRAQAPAFSKQFAANWAVCHSSSRI